MTSTISLIAAVGAGGAIGPADALPIFMDEQERDAYQVWFREMTKGGIVIFGHRTMDLFYESGFRAMNPDTTYIGWSRDTVPDPDLMLSDLMLSGRDIHIAGGRNTFATFAPYATEFNIRRVALTGPHQLFMPNLFGRFQ